MIRLTNWAESEAIATDDVLELHEQQSAEVDALVRLHSLTFEAACELVELCPSQYRPGERQVEYVPLPSEIAHLAKLIRARELVIR